MIRMKIMSLSILFFSFPTYSMDIFKTYKDQQFFIISKDQEPVVASYDQAVQMRAFHPLSDNKIVKSQHTKNDICSFLNVIKGIQDSSIGISSILPSASTKTIQVGSIMQENETISFKRMFARLCDNEEVRKKGSLYQIMSVAHELQATEFCMLTIGQCFEQKDHEALLSHLIPAQDIAKFKVIMDKYIFDKSGCSRKYITDLKDQLMVVENQLRQTTVVSSCRTKFACIEKDGNIGIYDKDNKLVKCLQKKSSPGKITTSVTLSSDGKRVACAEVAIDPYPHYSPNSHKSHCFCMWDVDSGELVGRWSNLGRAMNIALNHNGTMALVNISFDMTNGYRPSCNLVVDLKDIKVARTLYDQKDSGIAQNLYFKNDGKIVYTSSDGRFELDLNVGKKIMSQLDFAQLAFLCQLHEQAEKKKRTLPVWTGFFKEYVQKSLPQVFQDWVREKLELIRKQIK